MWFAIGEVVIAKVEEGVCHAAVEVLQAHGRVGLNIAVDVVVFFQCGKHRFVAQGAATEQATNVFLLWRQFGTHFFNQRPVEWMQVEGLFFDAGKQHSL
ncbi:hypothetical protein D3C80_1669270 [compost metagenome]